MGIPIGSPSLHSSTSYLVRGVGDPLRIYGDRMFVRSIIKLGKSHVITIPRPFVLELDLAYGEQVVVKRLKDGFFVRKLQVTHGARQLPITRTHR